MLALGAAIGGMNAELALAGGAAAGVALAIVGISRTRFEQTEQGWFYVPDARIGVALTVLLIGRLAYRLVQIGGFNLMGPASRAASQDAMRSPFTLLILGAVLAYYAAYAAGLLRWRLASR